MNQKLCLILILFSVIFVSLQEEEDYFWVDYLKNSADWFGGNEALKIADECIKFQVQDEGGWKKE